MLVRATYIASTSLISLVLALITGKLAHLSYPWIACLAIGLTCYLLFTNPAPADPAKGTLSELLEKIRADYKLPALAGAIFDTDKVIEIAGVGVRKTGTDVPVTLNDSWHLGSDTKMMTAALAGTFVAEKKLSWDDKVISFFPDLAGHIPDAMKTITVSDVLHHHAGLIENLNWHELSQTGSLSDQRRTAVAQALTAPAYPPGTYHYSNTDYVVIGAILEKISGKPWEELIKERIFQPLGMDSVGFGGLGTLGQIDQPWSHSGKGTPMPTNGPAMDNPEIMGPAGSVHCTMQDWAKFLTDQLRGGSDMKALLPAEIYTAMQTPVPMDKTGVGYGYGWIITDRSWAGGKALTHAGSNTMNYCVCWLAPGKKFGVLVCTNQGGDTATKACDEAASIMIRRYSVKQ